MINELEIVCWRPSLVLIRKQMSITDRKPNGLDWLAIAILKVVLVNIGTVLDFYWKNRGLFDFMWYVFNH